MASELDDLMDLAFQVAPRVTHRLLGVESAVVALEAPRVGAELVPVRCALPLDDDLAVLVAIVSPEPDVAQGKYIQRSRQLTQHARCAKALKRAKLDNQQLQLKHDDLVSQSAKAMASFPALRKVIDVPHSLVGSHLDDHVKAQVVVRLGVLPAAATRVGAISSVHRACSTLSRALQCVQQEVADALLVPPRYGSSAGHRVVVYSSQWDETMQKIRSPDRSGRAGAGRLSTQAVRIQTMVQSCKLDVFTFGLTGEVTHTEAPWFVRTLFLWRQTANILVEALLKQAPFRYDDVARMQEIAAQSHVFILAFCRDGASANSVALECVWDMLFHEAAPLNVIPLNHLCSLHRSAIARSRVKGVIGVAAGMQSFTKFIRVGKTWKGSGTASTTRFRNIWLWSGLVDQSYTMCEPRG
jgi:hypothetical protein